jgi:hypothetical protein
MWLVTFHGLLHLPILANACYRCNKALGIGIVSRKSSKSVALPKLYQNITNM